MKCRDQWTTEQKQRANEKSSSVVVVWTSNEFIFWKRKERKAEEKKWEEIVSREWVESLKDCNYKFVSVQKAHETSTVSCCFIIFIIHHHTFTPHNNNFFTPSYMIYKYTIKKCSLTKLILYEQKI